MKKTGQKGFTAVEALLVLVLLAILGFTGFYVYHAKQNADKSLSNAGKTSATPAQEYLNVPNFGIKVPLSGSLLHDIHVATTAGTKADTNAVGQVEFSSNDEFHANNTVSFCGTATNTNQELFIVDRDDSEAPVTTQPVETVKVKGHTYSVVPVTTPENNNCSTAAAKLMFTAKYQALLNGLKHAVAQ